MSGKLRARMKLFLVVVKSRATKIGVWICNRQVGSPCVVFISLSFNADFLSDVLLRN